MPIIAPFNQPHYCPVLKKPVSKKLAISVASCVLALHVLTVAGLLHLPAMAVMPPKQTPPLAISFVTPPVKYLAKPFNPPRVKAVATQPTTVKTKETATEETETKPLKAKTSEPKPVKPTLTPTADKPKAVENTMAKAHLPPMENKTTPHTDLLPSNPPSVIQTKPLATTDDSSHRPSTTKATKLTTATTPLTPPSQPDSTMTTNNDSNVAHKPTTEPTANTQSEPKKAEPKQPETQPKLSQSKPSNEPVKFGNGDAQWLSRPDTQLAEDLSEMIAEENLSRVGVRVNVSPAGSITQVVITQSSGNRQVDNAIVQRIKTAKLKPFIRGGVAVAGVGYLTIHLN